MAYAKGMPKRLIDRRYIIRPALPALLSDEFWLAGRVAVAGTDCARVFLQCAGSGTPVYHGAEHLRHADDCCGGDDVCLFGGDYGIAARYFVCGD